MLKSLSDLDSGLGDNAAKLVSQARTPDVSRYIIMRPLLDSSIPGFLGKDGNFN